MIIELILGKHDLCMPAAMATDMIPNMPWHAIAVVIAHMLGCRCCSTKCMMASYIRAPFHFSPSLDPLGNHIIVGNDSTPCFPAITLSLAASAFMTVTMSSAWSVLATSSHTGANFLQCPHHG